MTLRFFVIPTPELAPNAAALELEGPGVTTVQSGAWQAPLIPGNSAECGTHISRFSGSLLPTFGRFLIFDSSRQRARWASHSTLTARTAIQTGGPTYPNNLSSACRRIATCNDQG